MPKKKRFQGLGSIQKALNEKKYSGMAEQILNAFAELNKQLIVLLNEVIEHVKNAKQELSVMRIAEVEAREGEQSIRSLKTRVDLACASLVVASDKAKRFKLLQELNGYHTEIKKIFVKVENLFRSYTQACRSYKQYSAVIAEKRFTIQELRKKLFSYYEVLKDIGDPYTMIEGRYSKELLTRDIGILDTTSEYSIVTEVYNSLEQLLQRISDILIVHNIAAQPAKWFKGLYESDIAFLKKVVCAYYAVIDQRSARGKRSEGKTINTIAGVLHFYHYMSESDYAGAEYTIEKIMECRKKGCPAVFDKNIAYEHEVYKLTELGRQLAQIWKLDGVLDEKAFGKKSILYTRIKKGFYKKY